MKKADTTTVRPVSKAEREAIAKIVKALKVDDSIDKAIANFQHYDKFLAPCKDPIIINRQCRCQIRRPDIVAAVVVDQRKDSLIHGDVLSSEAEFFAIRPHRCERLNQKPPFRKYVIIRKSKVFCIRKQKGKQQ